MSTKIGAITWLDETTWNSTNCTPSGSVAATYGIPRVIKGITIHHWGMDGQSFENVANYLSRPNGNTSAHFVVEAGRAACLISPQDAAWHAGSAEGNATTIGIECRPEMTAADFDSLVDLCVWLESTYGSLDYYRHMDWSSTGCPGRYASQIDRLVSAVNARKGGGARPKSAPAKAAPAKATVQKPAAKKDSDPHWVVEKGDTLGKIARYYGVPDRVAEIARYNGVNPDRLSVGQKIFIPSPLVWVVEKGDTWEKIAAYYGFSVDLLKERNRGVSLTPGAVLTVF